MATEHPALIPIQIDHKPYRVQGPTMTGAQLRLVPPTPIGPEYDLWQDVPGHDDIKILNDTVVTLQPGMHFHSAPATIDPGAHRGPA